MARRRKPQGTPRKVGLTHERGLKSRDDPEPLRGELHDHRTEPLPPALEVVFQVRWVFPVEQVPSEDRPPEEPDRLDPERPVGEPQAPNPYAVAPRRLV